MKMFLYKGSLYKIKVIKEDNIISFKCVIVYFYDIFCYDLIRSEFNSEEFTLTTVKKIQEEIINNLNNKFRLKNK